MSENSTPDRPALRRDRDQKMIAGVCTGLGHHLDIDPVVFRILFAVLTFFGGLGILAYAACWLLIPAVGAGDSEAQRLLNGPNVYVAAGAAALMVLGVLWFTDIVADGFDRSIPLILAAAAAIGVLVWRRENQGGQGSGGYRGGPGGGPDSGNPFGQTQAWWQRPVSDQPHPSAAEPFGAGHSAPDSATRSQSSSSSPSRSQSQVAEPFARESYVPGASLSGSASGGSAGSISAASGSGGPATEKPETGHAAERIEPAGSSAPQDSVPDGDANA